MENIKMVNYCGEEYLSFNELCDLFDVSPNTMRKALKEIDKSVTVLQLTSHRKLYSSSSIIKAMKKTVKINIER
jgi:DeoR/GlpR family transcriptional regulator of sugar metabolism